MSKQKLTFIADTHHFSQSLSSDGRAYELRSGSDQKCLNETGGIIDAAFSLLAKSDTQAVMIIGDLTNDGEKVCHEEFRKKLYKLQKSKSVYVITATHDWCCDKNPRRFDGENVYHDVETLPPEQLRDFYFEFGPKQSNAEFITHLGTCSYTVDIGENVRLLALNDDQNGKGRAGFKEEHFQWIEKQIKKAQEDGKILIGMEHHLLIAHVHPLLTGGGTCVGEREYVASRLADAGLKYMFVGHSHIQAIDTFTSPNGNTITEINVGSLCGYPSPIVNVTIDETGLEISTQCAEQFEYNGKIYNTKAYLSKKAFDLVDRVVECGNLSKAEFESRLTALQLNGKKLAPLYFAAKPLLKRISKCSVNDVYKILKRFHLADNVKNQDIEAMADEKIMDIIHDLLLSFMDGSTVRHEKGSAYYNVVMGAAEAIVKIHISKLTLDIKHALQNLLLGGKYNINFQRLDF